MSGLGVWEIFLVVLFGGAVTLAIRTYKRRSASRRRVVDHGEPRPDMSASATTPSVRRSSETPSPDPLAAPVDSPADMPQRGIFLAYRREDSQHLAGRVYDRLIQQYGEGRVFKDVDSFPLGVDFRKSADDLISSCRVALVIVGRRFLGEQDASRRRIDDPADVLRTEIRTILGREIPLIPVLVDAAAMPSSEALPDDISPLAFRNGVNVREDPHFHADVDALLEGLDRILNDD